MRPNPSTKMCVLIVRYPKFKKNQKLAVAESRLDGEEHHVEQTDSLKSRLVRVIVSRLDVRGKFPAEVPDVDVSDQELKLARQLTDAMATDRVDLAAYKDRYQERLSALVDGRLKQAQVVQAPEPSVQVINLIAALQ
jgi:non-homologous end joining protein Ku